MRLLMPAIFLIVFLLSGCASVKPIPAEKLSEIKRIGVVSVLEDNLKMQYVGLTIFNNFTAEIPVKEWQIDQEVIKAYEDQIKNHTKMDFILLDYQSEPLLKGYKAGFDSKEILNELAEIARRNSLDAVILVKRAYFDDPITYEHSVNGYGVFQRSVLVISSSAMYLAADATLYEARTMEPLGKSVIYASEKVDNSYFTKDFSSLTEEQKALIESWIKTSIQDRAKIGLSLWGITPKEEVRSKN